MESLLDYTFMQLGINGEEGNIGRPIVMTEAVANLGYSRRSMHPDAQDGTETDRRQ